LLSSLDEKLPFVFIKFAIKIYFITKMTNAYILDNRIYIRCRRGRDRIVVGFTATYAISAYYH